MVESGGGEMWWRGEGTGEMWWRVGEVRCGGEWGR